MKIFQTKQIKIHNSIESEIDEFGTILSAGRIQEDLIESPQCAKDYKIIGNHEILAEGQRIQEERIIAEREAEKERRRQEKGKRGSMRKMSSMSQSKYQKTVKQKSQASGSVSNFGGLNFGFRAKK